MPPTCLAHEVGTTNTSLDRELRGLVVWLLAPGHAAPFCTRELGPRTVPHPAIEPAAAVEVPQSRLIAEARLPLATLASELEQNVAPRLAEGRGVKSGRRSSLWP